MSSPYRHARSFRTLVRPAGADPPTSTTGLAARCRGHGTRGRLLPAGRQPLPVPALPRRGHTYAQPAAGFDTGTTTARRYVTGAADVLTTFAPALAETVEPASAKAFVTLDGTPPPADRIAADRSFHSGEHKKHCIDAHVVTAPHGRLP
ncbi:MULTISPECIES: hypothetical protein [unclassified Streptomyces]|uniref:hypothetical protein n=1 Tax=unclassified Streptomyces TaxID=2593676 RepID=UPI0006970355|nr:MULTISPECIES: hypothetical protein [unclassified Streptomyces]ODA73552.1 hypothetical protein APS67_002132 [Streptomyces sp. AVP053U2]